MEKKDKGKGNNNRPRLVPALLLVLLITAAFFVTSDAPFIKSARDSLMHKLGYEAIDQENSSETSGEAGSDETGDGENGSSEGVRTTE